MKFHNLVLVSAVSVLIASAVLSNQSPAGWFGGGTEEPKVNVPFPTDEASFSAVQKEFGEKPQDNSLLEYHVTLPQDWLKAETQQGFETSFSLAGSGGEPNAVSRDLPTDIATYKSPYVKGHTLDLKIQSVKLFNEISAKHWLERYITLQNLILQGDVQAISDKEATALYTTIENDVSRTVKVHALINSNVMMLVNFSYPTAFEKYTQFLQDKVLASFTLVNKTDEPIEKIEVLDMKETISFEYPASWMLYKKDVEDPKYMYAQLQNVIHDPEKRNFDTGSDAQLLGLIEVALIKRRESTNLMKEIGQLRQRIESSMDVSFKTMIETEAIPANKRFIFSRYEAYPAEMKDNSKQNKEIHLAVLGDENWYMIAFLYTPTKDEDSYIWARNVQSFKMLIKSMK